MNAFTGYRFYTITEQTTAQGWTDFIVWEGSDPVQVDRFTYRTAQEAEDALRAAGYVKVKDRR